MATRLMSLEDAPVALPVEVKLGGSLPEMESGIRDVRHEIGTSTAPEALHRFDTDKAPIGMAGRNQNRPKDMGVILSGMDGISFLSQTGR